MYKTMSGHGSIILTFAIGNRLVPNASLLEIFCLIIGFSIIGIIFGAIADGVNKK